MITPFDENDKLDEEGFRLNVHYQVNEGVDGLVISGTTGEAPTLTRQEKKRLMVLAREEAKELPLMIGCGTNCTKQTIENLKWAADLGADSALIVAPYYNKPMQEGLFRHFEALSKTTSIPILAYNIKGRTAVHIETETLIRIAELPNIVGVKDSSGDLVQASEIKQRRAEFLLFCGEDALTAPFMALGGDGVISVASNLAPQLMKTLIKSGNSKQLSPLFKALCLESNPIPIKAAMNIVGRAAGLPRLPLTPLSKTNEQHLASILQQVLR